MKNSFFGSLSHFSVSVFQFSRILWLFRSVHCSTRSRGAIRGGRCLFRVRRSTSFPFRGGANYFSRRFTTRLSLSLFLSPSGSLYSSNTMFRVAVSQLVNPTSHRFYSLLRVQKDPSPPAAWPAIELIIRIKCRRTRPLAPPIYHQDDGRKTVIAIHDESDFLGSTKRSKSNENEKNEKERNRQ